MIKEAAIMKDGKIKTAEYNIIPLFPLKKIEEFNMYKNNCVD